MGETEVQLSGLISGLGAWLMFVFECLDVFFCLVWVRGWSVWTSESVFGFDLELRGCLCPTFSFEALNLDFGLGLFSLSLWSG